MQATDFGQAFAHALRRALLDMPTRRDGMVSATVLYQCVDVAYCSALVETGAEDFQEPARL